MTWADEDQADLILTTGGTGLSPTDITPEATRAVLDREAPGIAERIRVLSLTDMPRAALARGVGRRSSQNSHCESARLDERSAAMDSPRSTRSSPTLSPSCAATRPIIRPPRTHEGTPPLQDVEPAVRINAVLERDGVETALVSPLDDIRSSIRRAKPDVLVFTGDLTDPLTVSLVKEQLWDGAPSVGLAESSDPDLSCAFERSGTSKYSRNR